MLAPDLLVGAPAGHISCVTDLGLNTTHESPSLAASASSLSLRAAPFPLSPPLDLEAPPLLELMDDHTVIIAAPPPISASTSASVAPTSAPRAFVVSVDKTCTMLLRIPALADTPNTHAPLHAKLCRVAEFAHGCRCRRVQGAVLRWGAARTAARGQRRSSRTPHELSVLPGKVRPWLR